MQPEPLRIQWLESVDANDAVHKAGLGVRYETQSPLLERRRLLLREWAQGHLEWWVTKNRFEQYEEEGGDKRGALSMKQ